MPPFDGTIAGSDINSQNQAVSPKWDKLLSHCQELLQGLDSERWSWWTHWRMLAQYILPRRYVWLVTPNRGNRGSPINQNIIDSSGTLAMRTLAAGMMSGITSPTRPWFKLGTNDDQLNTVGPVKDWLSEVRDRMLRVMAESNYYNAKAVQYQDISTFGTAPLIIYEDFEDVIRCQNPAAGEYYCANSDRMAVDTLYRKFVMTVRQVADMFGLENCSQTIRGSIETGGGALTREVIVAHAIEPNSEHIAGAPGLNGYPFREVYWEYGEKSCLRVRGFHEQPFSAPRWDVVNNDAYGRSPAMDALGDIMQLQVMTKREAQAIDKMVNPPLVGDIALKNEPASMLPGGVTWADLRNNNIGFKPVYQVQPNLREFSASKMEVKQRIGQCFYNDLFLMISQLDTVRTATEIDARREEKLIMLGPVLERFQNESLNVEVDRIFAICLRAGVFPPPPPILQGMPLKIEYVSMLVAAQRAVSTAAIERLMQFVGNLAGADPGALDNIDFDETIDTYADQLGVPANLVRPLAQVAQMRAARAQQQQAQAALQASMAAVEGAKNLSQTDVGGGQNALSAMLGNQAQGNING